MASTGVVKNESETLRSFLWKAPLCWTAIGLENRGARKRRGSTPPPSDTARDTSRGLDETVNLGRLMTLLRFDSETCQMESTTHGEWARFAKPMGGKTLGIVSQ